MPPKAPAKTKVYRNKKTGERYVRIGKKKINIPPKITQSQLIQWLIKYLKPKRKKSKRTTPTVPVKDSEPNLADENVRDVVNYQRAAEGKAIYGAPIYPKGPVPFKAPALYEAPPTSKPVKPVTMEKKTEMDIITTLNKANRADRFEKERNLAETKLITEKKDREEAQELHRKAARAKAILQLEKDFKTNQLKKLFLGLPVAKTEQEGRFAYEHDHDHNLRKKKIYTKPYFIQRLIAAKDPTILDAIENLEKEISGQGILDVFGGVRTGPSPAVRKYLEQHGEELITAITVARQPITPIIEKVAGWLSLGKWQANKDKLAYDKMMHLFMIVTLESGLKFNFEKNHLPEISSRTSLASTDKNKIESLVVEPTKAETKVEPKKEEPKVEPKVEAKEEPKEVESKAESKEVELTGSGKNFGTLQDMITKADKLAGGNKLWVYDPITQNCQYFVKYCVQATGSLTSELTKFIMQDAAKVIEGLSWFHKIARGLTDAKNLLDVATNGRGMEGKGITNFEIDKYMANYRPHYLGCIARDQWQNLTALAPSWSAWIMNTDTSDKTGIHWVAFYLDQNHHTIEYYDSFADDIPDDVLISLKKKLETNVSRYYLKLKVNRVVDQSATSDNCGWFAMRFIIDRSRGKPWRDCTKFNQSVQGEDAIKKFKAQFGEFKYI